MLVKVLALYTVTDPIQERMPEQTRALNYYFKVNTYQEHILEYYDRIQNFRLCPFTGLRPGEVQRAITVSSTGEDLLIQGRMTCKSSNLLYMITCEKGGPTCPSKDQHVGETGQTGEERFSEHRNTVVQDYHQGTTKPVGAHFQGPGHSVSDLRFTPIEKIKNFSREAKPTEGNLDLSVTCELSDVETIKFIH